MPSESIPVEPKSFPDRDSPFMDPARMPPEHIIHGAFDEDVLDRLISTVSSPDRAEPIQVRQHPLDPAIAGAAVRGDHQIGIGFHGDLHLFEPEFIGPQTDGYRWRTLINEDYPPPARFISLTHELAHIYLGHLGPSEITLSGWADRREVPHHTREAECAWVSHLIAEAIGLEAGEAILLQRHSEAQIADAGSISLAADLAFAAALRISHEAGLAQVDADMLSRLLEIDDAPTEPHILSADGRISTKADAPPDHNDILRLVDQALTAPTRESLSQFIDFASRMRRLAAYNLYMVYIQRPGASAVATRADWKAVGQTVMPDATPIVILRNFGPIELVYELSDTMPLMVRDPRGDAFGATSDGTFDAKRYVRLTAKLRSAGKPLRIDVQAVTYGSHLAGTAATSGTPLLDTVESLAGGTLATGRIAHGNVEKDTVPDGPFLYRVRINRRLTDAEQFATLAHELGHIFCGHLGAFRPTKRSNDEGGWPDRRDLNNVAMEIEAELVAWLVCSRSGVITGSPLYLKQYLEDELSADVMKFVSPDAVIRAVARIERMAR